MGCTLCFEELDFDVGYVIQTNGLNVVLIEEGMMGPDVEVVLHVA